MTSSSSSKDKFFEKFIDPYLPEVMKHPQNIQMHERVLHTWDVQGPKREGSEKARLAVVEQEFFKCQGMVERGLSANHSMIIDFICKNKKDNNEIVEIILKLHDRLQDLQAQIFI
ncbi:40S ribosomal protein S5-1 [Hordeum vulgare]|nr:40S ribosomal protein S5-1 [Hordeum vulgare]